MKTLFTTVIIYAHPRHPDHRRRRLQTPRGSSWRSAGLRTRQPALCWVSHAPKSATLLVGEIMLLTVDRAAAGLVAGYGFAALSAQSLSSEIVNIPLVVSKSTFGWATVLVFVSALVSVSSCASSRRVDLASALKQKE